MKRLIPFAALCCLPLAAIGCAPEDDVDPVGTDPVVTDPVGGTMTDDMDGDVDVDTDATAIESGSGMSAVAPAGDAPALASADFEGQVVFSVPDMTCPFSCAPEVESTLARMPGVLGVETNVDARTATVKVGDGFDVEAAKAALAEKRFPVDNVL